MTVRERREREREERRESILDAAEATFHSKGLHEATMGDVARAAEVAKGTLYRYFDSKEQLLRGLVQRKQQLLLDRFDALVETQVSGLELVRRLLEAWAKHIGTPEAKLRMVMSMWASGCPLFPGAGEDPDLVGNARRMLGTIGGAIDRGRADGSIRPGRPSAALALHLWSGVNGALLLQLQKRAMGDSPLGPAIPDVNTSIDMLLDELRYDAAVESGAEAAAEEA